MKIYEIVIDWLIETSLFEMAFARRAIIERLRSYQSQINRHALKIIAWPDSRDVPHWRHELTVWGNDFAGMTLRSGKRLRPIGFDLPWKHLYLEPFEDAEEWTLAFLLARLQQEGYSQPVTKPLRQIMIEYMIFIRSFCQAIGSQQAVGNIVNALGQKAINNEDTQ